MKKLSMLLVAVLAVAMMMGFIGCKQEDDVPSGPSAVATWENSTITGGEGTLELTAFDDKSWKLVAKAGAQSLEYAKGTYTGDATKDGTLECKMTHELDGNVLKEITPQPFNCAISNSGKTLTMPGVLFDGPEDSNIPFTRK